MWLGFIRCFGDLLRCCVVVSSVVAEPALGSEVEPALGSECTTATPLAFANKTKTIVVFINIFIVVFILVVFNK